LVTVFVNGSPSESRIVKLTQPEPPPYEVWRATHFTVAEWLNPDVSGDLADPDRDGIPNLLEYLQALDPKVSDAHLLPVAGLQDGSLTLSYRRNKNATDVIHSVECSDDMSPGSWAAEAIPIGQVDMGGYWLVTAVDQHLISSSPRRFMRLTVEKP
ncbi:MAG: hypothetical protein K9M97_05070, partial [Akkermansiaceae bacterium]|nr:hypothetical protein [Akkermansiaceae bacterium]